MQNETVDVIPAIAAVNADETIAANTGKQPAVLWSIFYSIFIETPKDFFEGILGFFGRYFKHFIHSFKYFWNPSLKVAPFDTKDYKEDAQRTFELALIVTAFLIFMIKQDIIPVDKQLQENYGNDLMQMVYEFVIFLAFGIAYLVSILGAVIFGRLFKLLFSIRMTGKEVDVLSSYLNNSVFSITVIIAFIFRCDMQFAEVANDQGFHQNVFALYFLMLLSVIAVWSYRFAKLNGLTGFRRFLFPVISSLFFSLFFSYVSYTVTIFILGT